MNQRKFRNQLDLAEEAEKLGKKALELGLIASFSIRYFPDTWEFCIPATDTTSCLTPEEAYLHFKQISEQANKS